MFSAPTSAAVAGIQALVVAGALLAFGYALAGAVLGRRGDRVLRAGLALPALCGYVLVLTAVHLASGGALFAHPWVVRVLTAAVAVGCTSIVWRKHREGEPSEGHGPLLMLGLLGIGLVAWGAPAFREFPLFDPLPLEFGGDTKLHLGWTMQMMNGERLPTSPLTGDIPNYYPWFFHALLAFISDLTPGGRSFHGLGPLHFLQVGGGVLSFFALGREVTKRYLGAVTAAAFGALSGGIGWVVARGPALEVDRSDPMSYLGDLALVRSYNSSFHNLAPTLPREVAYALLPAFVLLLLNGMRNRGSAFFVAAGGVGGIIGLTGAEGFFLCCLVTLALPLVLPAGERLSSMLRVALPLAAVSALWFGPTIVNYVRLGGFVNTTIVGPVRLPPMGILGAWGLVTLFAALGIVRAGRHLSGRAVRLLLVTSASAVVLVVVATQASSEGAFGVLGRAHRYWPLLHLSLVPLAARGVVWLGGRLASHRSSAPVLAAAIVALSIPSPILGSLALSDRWLEPPEIITSALEGGGGSPLELMDTTPGGETCVVAVPEELAHSVFWFSGYRLVHYRWAPYSESNFARVRWAEMSEHVPWDERRLRDNETLLSGSDVAGWDEVADRYGVDHVLTTSSLEREGTFGGALRTSWNDYVMLSRTDCGAGS